MPNDKMTKYDLEERIAKFGEEIIRFAKKFLLIRLRDDWDFSYSLGQLE